MLGTEPALVENYVASGDVRIVFWPVINHGQPSVYSTVAFECVGQQDVEKAFVLHKLLFTDQTSLWSADMDYYVAQAEAVGANREQFIACYTDQATVDTIMALDRIRQDRGVYSQPVFDINGEGVLLGAQPFEVFDQILKTLLPE